MSRIKKSGFIEVIQKFNGNEQLASQCDIRFERGRPWLEKSSQDDTGAIHDDTSDRGLSSTLTPPVVQDDTLQSPVTGGTVTCDRGVQSRVTDEHSEMNPVKEHGEDNIPGSSAPGVPAPSRDDRACGADRPKLNRKPANYQQTSQEAERDWIELNRILTGTSEDADHQPGERSDQGAKVRWHNLLRSGVPSSQIVTAAQDYKDRKPFGEWESGVGGFLTYSFDTDQLPDGTYPDDKLVEPPIAANDDQCASERKQAAGDRYSKHYDEGAPF